MTPIIWFASSVLASLIGLAIRWWWTNHKRDREIAQVKRDAAQDVDYMKEVANAQANHFDATAANRWLRERKPNR